MGKLSFQYAWVLDEMQEEREKGITIDTNERTIGVGEKKIHFIDTPGHTDFIFNTMKGASQAEVAIVLLDAKNFNKDLNNNLYEKHLDMIQSNEIHHVIICVNKMDQIEWNQFAYESIIE